MVGPGNETLSSMLGWMSIACWIVVYTPQIIENYQLQSGEGLSVLFVLIWLAGDLCNLFGGILAGLLPTIIILAAYYTACDAILLVQIYYYRWANSKPTATLFPETNVPGSVPSEETPLISAGGSDKHEKQAHSALRSAVKYGASLVFILGTGVAAWAIDEALHQGEPRQAPEEVLEWRSQLLGWISAVLYIGARIPQILKNLQTKCEGLSPALFLFSIAGNTTYVLSILAISVDFEHLATNAGWIAGSSLTVFLDVFVLAQFFYYQSMSDHQAPLSAEA